VRINGSLDEFSTFAGPATAGQLSIVVRTNVVTGKFIACVDILSGIKFRSAIGDADEHIGIARVIDEGKRPPAPSTVKSDCITDFHDCDPLGSPGSFSGFAERDALAGELPNLLACTQSHVCEQSLSLD
jgi:hypothetical protein